VSAARSGLVDALARGSVLALAFGAVTALRIAERGEAFSPRTALVIALFAAGGFVAGAIGAPILRRLRPASPRRRFALGALGGTALLLATVFALFAFDRNTDLAFQTLAEVGWRSFLIHGLLGLTIDAGGAFAVTARPYLLPWPLIAMALAAGLVLGAAPARRVALTSIGAALLASTVAFAPDARADDWTREKCVRYTAAWHEAIERLGTSGISEDFIIRHDAFIASGCTAAADVCPRSDAELALANVMVILAMNAGTASTFPPFACRD